MKKRRFHLVLWLWMEITFVRSSFCPRECRCDRNRKRVFCIERNLEVVPVEIPESTEIVFLQRNKIISSRETDRNLQKLLHLRELDLHKNKLTTLPQNLPVSLEVLSVRQNSISYFDDETLPTLVNLKELHLDSNELRDPYVFKTLFYETTNLFRLTLSHNEFKVIPFNLPYSAKYLRLDFNEIELVTKKAMSSLPNLNCLDLSHNKIRFIELDSFSFPLSFETLILSGNRLEIFPKKLPSSLKKLDLAANKIKSVAVEDCQYLPKLVTLNLSNNRLQVIQQTAFDYLISLNEMELNGNLWKCDCKLNYLNKWLLNATSVVSNKQSLQCHFPHKFKGTSIINADIVRTQCPKPVILNAAVFNITGLAASICFNVSNADETDVKYFLSYGLSNCSHCTKRIQFQKNPPRAFAAEKPKKRKTNFCKTLSSLLPMNRYTVCFFGANNFGVNISLCKHFFTPVLLDVSKNHGVPEVVKEKVDIKYDYQSVNTLVKKKKPAGTSSWIVFIICLIATISSSCMVTLFVRQKQLKCTKLFAPCKKKYCFTEEHILDAQLEFDITIIPTEVKTPTFAKNRNSTLASKSVRVIKYLNITPQISASFIDCHYAFSNSTKKAIYSDIQSLNLEGQTGVYV